MKPITPLEAGANKLRYIPEGVISAFNELIIANLKNGTAKIKQNDVLSLIQNKYRISREIKVGDVVLRVNGELVDEGLNDIKGSSPGRINLTIYRNGIIIVIQLDRVKVYY